MKINAWKKVVIGLGFVFKFAHKFTSLIDIILQLNFGRKKIILKKTKKNKQYLQVFANFHKLWVSKKSTGKSYRRDP